MSDEEAIMAGYRYAKAIVNRYGTAKAADLMTLAGRLVRQGEFRTKREAVEAIEKQMGLTPTLPLSRETAEQGSRDWIRNATGGES